jgi:hypothetical protein
MPHLTHDDYPSDDYPSDSGGPPALITKAADGCWEARVDGTLLIDRDRDLDALQRYVRRQGWTPCFPPDTSTTIL